MSEENIKSILRRLVDECIRLEDIIKMSYENEWLNDERRRVTAKKNRERVGLLIERASRKIYHMIVVSKQREVEEQ